MLSELRVWSLVFVTAIIWATLAVASLVSRSDVLSLIVDALPLLLMVAYAFERRGWRARWLHPRWVATPVIIGTWRGELSSQRQGVTESPLPKVVYLTVRQSLTTALVRLLTDESTSEQVAGSIAKGETGYPTVAYLYRNKPRIELRLQTSNIHYGAAVVEIVGDPATELKGEYWTERQTKGSLTFREHAPVIAQTHEEAARLSYGPARPLGVLER